MAEIILGKHTRVTLRRYESEDGIWSLTFMPVSVRTGEPVYNIILNETAIQQLKELFAGANYVYHS